MKKLCLIFCIVNCVIPIVNSQTIIYNIPAAQLVNAPNPVSCPPNTGFYSCAGDMGFSWTSLAATIPSSITVEFNYDIDAGPGTNAYGTTLNGAAQPGTFTPPVDVASCLPDNIYTFSCNPANYNPLALNTFIINSTAGSTCSGLNTTALLGGFYARVTVNYGVPTPPVNDDPCTATALTVSGTCTFNNFSNALAGNSVGVPAPGCAVYSGGDVWFTAVVPPSGVITFNTQQGIILDGGMAVYSGSCGSLTLVACDDNSSVNPNMPMISLTGQTPGTTLWIRVWENGNDNNGSFGICAFEPPPPPVNDNPCTATALAVLGSCTYNNFTNISATSSAGVPAPGCAGYSGGDVWFTAVVPATGNIAFDTQVGVILDGGMAIYSGSCGSLSLVACDDNASVNGNMPAISLTGLTPGATLWIRVWENGNNNNGSFGICVYDPTPPPNPGDCPSAINVCSNTSFGITPSGPGSIVEFFANSISNPNTNPNCCNQGCLISGEVNSTWLLVNIQGSGTLQFSFGSPGPGGGYYDWSLFGPYTSATCGNIASNSQPPLACNWNQNGVHFTGMANPVPAGGVMGNFEQPLAVTAGQKYVICFTNWSSLNTTVPFNFFGTATIGCTPLPVELESFYCSQKGNRMFIEWSTSAEVNNHHFIVERSLDGVNFSAIGTELGAGNSNSSIKYSFIDDSPQQGSNYYRLKQVDFNGDNTTYGASSCEFDYDNSGATVTIYSMTGQFIQSIQSFDYKFDVNALVLPTGMYMIQIITGDDVIHQTHYHGSYGGHWYGN